MTESSMLRGFEAAVGPKEHGSMHMGYKADSSRGRKAGNSDEGWLRPFLRVEGHLADGMLPAKGTGTAAGSETWLEVVGDRIRLRTVRG